MADRELELIVKMLTDTRSMDKSIKGIDQRLQGWGRSALKLGAGLGLAIGAKEAISFMGSAIDKANDLEEAQSKVDVIFGESARSMRQWAADSAESYRMSERQATMFLGSVGSLAKGLGFMGDELGDVSVELTKLGADLASFNNVSIDVGVQAVLSGLAGESEPLRRFGIDVRKARVETDALAAGLEGATDAQRLLNSITSQAEFLGISGDSIRTMDTAVGKTEQLRVKMENLEVAVGQMLVPWKEWVVDLAIQGVDNLNGIADGIDNIGQGVGELVKDFTMTDIREELGLTNAAFQEWGRQYGPARAAEDLIEMRKALEAFAASDAGREAARQLGGLAEVSIDTTGAVDDLTAGIIASAETLGDLRMANIDMSDVFTVTGDLFDFDFGSPTEWVDEINKELRETNLELSEFLNSKGAQKSLQDGIDVMEKRLTRLLNQTTTAMDMDTAGGNLMTVFGASVYNKVGKAKGDVGLAMEDLGLSTTGDFITGATPTLTQWLSILPDRTTIMNAGRTLGGAFRTGFMAGLQNVTNTGGYAGRPDVPFGDITVNLHTSGDPMEVERAVLGALRRHTGHNGITSLRGI